MKAIDGIISRHSQRVFAFLVLGPPLIGFYPLTGLINPLWGSIFGFPLHLAASAHRGGGPHPWTEPAAYALWPIIVLGTMEWGASRLMAWAHPARSLAIAIWIASAAFVVPFQVAMDYFGNWPLYGAFE